VFHRLVLTLLAACVAACLVAVSAPAAHAEVAWLCSPHMDSDPCRGDLTTTYFASDGSSRVEQPKVPANPPIDCFYVYPTVSNQPTPNATQSPDPEVRSIALYQAQRFSTRCRIFVPLYRQVTAAGVSTASQTHDTSGYETAYADVREAWLHYLRDDNRGRGVVLVGHSQGSRMLRALIRREIDPDPVVRDLLVSAIIPGANATVAKGRKVGGDFENVPACESADQTGCVISYSTFNKEPPDNARFGRTDTDPVGSALDLPTGEGLEVLCVDPAALSGSAELESLLPSEPFAPGVIAALLYKLYGGPPPTADTPWLQPSDHYTGRCETSNGANVLMLSPVGDARMLNPSPDDTWGVHLVDLNIALGNLVKIVGVESASWRLDHRPLRVRLRALGRGRLVAIVTGSRGRSLQVALRRGARLVARRTGTLGPRGRARVRFRVRRAGRYRVTVRTTVGEVARSGPVRTRRR
jgi:pimeloyl-ACP methyl ester carboxylesterase